jgi:hypothetical protein
LVLKKLSFRTCYSSQWSEKKERRTLGLDDCEKDMAAQHAGERVAPVAVPA